MVTLPTAAAAEPSLFWRCGVGFRGVFRMARRSSRAKAVAKAVEVAVDISETLDALDGTREPAGSGAAIVDWTTSVDPGTGAGS